MRNLSQEGSNFTLVGGSILACAESRKGNGGIGERLVGIEVGVLACCIIGVLEDLLKQVGCHK